MLGAVLPRPEHLKNQPGARCYPFHSAGTRPEHQPSVLPACGIAMINDQHDGKLHISNTTDPRQPFLPQRGESCETGKVESCIKHLYKSVCFMFCLRRIELGASK